MVFSFSLAILIASRSIPRELAFAIFVGSASLNGPPAAAFTSGLHSAFYASMGLMVVAALFSVTRAARSPRGTEAPVALDSGQSVTTGADHEPIPRSVKKT
jgi:hypothetical protein